MTCEDKRKKKTVLQKKDKNQEMRERENVRRKVGEKKAKM